MEKTLVYILSIFSIIIYRFGPVFLPYSTRIYFIASIVFAILSILLSTNTLEYEEKKDIIPWVLLSIVSTVILATVHGFIFSVYAIYLSHFKVKKTLPLAYATLFVNIVWWIIIISSYAK